MQNVKCKEVTFRVCLCIILIFLVSPILVGCLTPFENQLSRASNAYSTQHYSEAISEFTKVIELQPGNASSYYWRGSCYYQTTQYDLAIADFSKAIVLKHKSIDEDYNFRGLCYFAKQEYPLAISDFYKAIEILQNPLYYNNRGLTYQKQSEYDLAISDFSYAIGKASTDSRLYFSRANAYLSTGQNIPAINDFKKIVELSNDASLVQQAKEKLIELTQ
jgi:tetratricopeptide (TPR) repeat protein